MRNLQCLFIECISKQLRGVIALASISDPREHGSNYFDSREFLGASRRTRIHVTRETDSPLSIDNQHTSFTVCCLDTDNGSKNSEGLDYIS